MKKFSMQYLKFELTNTKSNHKISKAYRMSVASTALFWGAILLGNQNFKIVHAANKNSYYNNNLHQSQSSSASLINNTSTAPDGINDYHCQKVSGWDNVFNSRVYTNKTVNQIEKLQNHRKIILLQLKIAQNLVMKFKMGYKEANDAASIFKNISLYDNAIHKAQKFDTKMKKINRKIKILKGGS